MSFLIVQIAVYHPKNDQGEERVLFDHTIQEDKFGMDFTTEIRTGGSMVGDKLPLCLGLRRVAGSSSGINQSLATLTFGGGGDTKAYTKSLTFDLDATIGSDYDWHGMYIGHEEPVELGRLHFTWGGSTVPTPTP